MGGGIACEEGAYSGREGGGVACGGSRGVWGVRGVACGVACGEGAHSDAVTPEVANHL